MHYSENFLTEPPRICIKISIVKRGIYMPARYPPDFKQNQVVLVEISGIVCLPPGRMANSLMGGVTQASLLLPFGN
jgi:hypothetical protein